MRSEGQAWAAEQLAEISNASQGAFECIETIDPAADNDGMVVMVSVNCRPFEKKHSGVSLRARERLRISIPWNFPLNRPEVHFTHKRYGGTSHVQ